MLTMSLMSTPPSPFASHAAAHGGARVPAKSQLSPKTALDMLGWRPEGPVPIPLQRPGTKLREPPPPHSLEQLVVPSGR